MANDDDLGRSDPDLRLPCRRDDQHHACRFDEIGRPGRSSRAGEMGLWPVSMLVAAELLRVLRVLRLSSSTVVAWAQALVVLALVIQSSHYTWPCRTQGQFSASLRVLHQIEPTSGRELRTGLARPCFRSPGASHYGSHSGLSCRSQLSWRKGFWAGRPQFGRPRPEPLRHVDYLGYILLRRGLLTRTGVHFGHKLGTRSRVVQRNRDELSAIAGLHSHQHGMFALVTQLCELLANVRRRRHRVTGNIEDHVAFLHAAACRWSIGVDRRHRNAAATGAVDITRRREGETEALCTVLGRAPALFAGAGLTLVRQTAEGERQGLVLTIVEHGELHRGTWRNRCDLPREIARVLDVLAVDSRDNVTSNDASLCGGAASLGLIDDGTFGLLHAEAVRNIRGHRLYAYANPPAGHVAVILQLRHHHLCGVGWDIETDAHRAPRRRVDRGVDADDVAVDVEGRSAGVAFVDRGVDLDEVVIRTGPDVAAACRNDAGRHRVAEAEWIADRNHPVASTRFAIREFHERKVVAVNLDQGQVGVWINADDLGRQVSPIVGDHLDGLGIVDHVIVGHRVAIGRNEEARALSGHVMPQLWHVSEAKLPEELVEWGALLEWRGVIVEAVHLGS